MYVHALLRKYKFPFIQHVSNNKMNELNHFQKSADMGSKIAPVFEPAGAGFSQWSLNLGTCFRCSSLDLNICSFSIKPHVITGPTQQ